ncbi:MAG: CBS domain-containing protein [Acidobacteria bacterium]|nr:CBS domain-containing protein [Acidobacteriota bacterium]
MLGLSALDVAQLVVLGALLWLTATVAVAARGLNRVQRRIWATGDRDEAADDGGPDAVAAAFVSLNLARQTWLVLLTVRVTVAALAMGWSLGQVVAVALLVYLIVDKLLPYWTVALAGAGVALGALRLVFVAQRAVFSLPAGYLQGRARQARERQRALDGEPDGGDLGTFLDMAEEEGLVSESEEALLRGVAEFDDAVVREIMTPRVDVVAIESDATLRDLQKLIAEHRLSRIPVISDNLDQVVGVTNLKDLVTALGETDSAEPITRIIRPAHFVPETKKVNELLGEFQLRREQLSIVVDEYGGTAGVVTLEDVLEEIVGEIQDEDEDEETLVEVSPDGVLASGKAELEELEAAVGIDIEEGEFHTVGGLVFRELGRVPLRGESFEYGGLRFDVVDADERRVHRVRVTVIETETAEI